MTHSIRVSTLLVLIAAFLSPPVLAQTMVKKKCGDGKVRVEGRIVNFGVEYHEIAVIEKIGSSSSHEGDWRLESFKQIMTYPHPLGIAITTHHVVQLAPGISLDVVARAQGNQVTAESTPSNVVLTIRNGVFYAKANMTPLGTVEGDTLRFKWDQGNVLAPTMEGELTGDYEEVSVSLIHPNPIDRRFVFNFDKPGVLALKLRAKVQPAHHAPKLQWHIDSMEGSDMVAVPASRQGPEVDVTFTGLPPSNNQFGKKEVKASLDIDGCKMFVKLDIEVFYPTTITNNPSGTLPNWYYYWIQTPAARPENVGVVLQYEGRATGLCQLKPSIPMHYRPMHYGGNGRISVCDLSNIDGDFFFYEFPRLYRDLNAIEPIDVGVADGYRTVRFIDLFAAGLLHEYQHKKFDEQWRTGKTLAEVKDEDRDDDGIPDSQERLQFMRFIVGMKQSWYHDHPVLKTIGFDEEWLAYEIMNGYQDGTYDKYDWSKPGKQWPEP